MATPEYPEHEKLDAVKHLSQPLGEFLEWLDDHGYVIAEYAGKSGWERLQPVRKGGIQRWLAEYFQIDLAKIDAEKDDMLARIRAMNERKEGTS